MIRELPMLNEAKCTGCGECVRLCPTNCLVMTPYRQSIAGIPWLIRPRDCIACTVCEVVCPSSAITMQPLIGSRE